MTYLVDTPQPKVTRCEAIRMFRALGAQGAPELLQALPFERGASDERLLSRAAVELHLDEVRAELRERTQAREILGLRADSVWQTEADRALRVQGLPPAARRAVLAKVKRTAVKNPHCHSKRAYQIDALDLARAIEAVAAVAPATSTKTRSGFPESAGES